MFELKISDRRTLKLEHLVLDYNGTIAEDGELKSGVIDLMNDLSDIMILHVLTADTHGSCRKKLDGAPVRISVLEGEPEDSAKLNYIKSLGEQSCACLGNGLNDRLMLQASALGIAVIGTEGAAGPAVMAADVICTDILDALNLFLHPARLVATLRV